MAAYRLLFAVSTSRGELASHDAANTVHREAYVRDRLNGGRGQGEKGVQTEASLRHRDLDRSSMDAPSTYPSSGVPSSGAPSFDDMERDQNPDLGPSISPRRNNARRRKQICLLI